MSDVTIRKAQNCDSKVIQTILATTFKDYEIDLPQDYSFADVENLEEQYLARKGTFMVLLRGEDIIGFCALLPSGKNTIELKRLYLTAGERGQGLGKNLLKMALDIAGESGYQRIHLETTSRFVEAVGLYRKFGFVDHVGADLSPGHDIALVLDL